MARKAKRDLTMEEQLARGPLDLPFLMLVLFLLGIGLVMLFSASYYPAYRDPNPPVSNNPYYYIIRQAAFAGAGVVCMYIISRINYQHFRWMSVFVLGASIVLMLMVFVPGIGKTGGGALRWVSICGIRFQPSEIAKVALFLASDLSSYVSGQVIHCCGAMNC